MVFLLDIFLDLWIGLNYFTKSRKNAYLMLIFSVYRLAIEKIKPTVFSCFLDLKVFKQKEFFMEFHFKTLFLRNSLKQHCQKRRRNIKHCSYKTRSYCMVRDLNKLLTIVKIKWRVSHENWFGNENYSLETRSFVWMKSKAQTQAGFIIFLWHFRDVFSLSMPTKLFPETIFSLFYYLDKKIKEKLVPWRL